MRALGGAIASIAVVVTMSTGAVPPAHGAGPGAIPLQLPNLVPEQPSDVHITGAGATEELRFTTITGNRGDWWLDVAGEATGPDAAIARQCVRFLTGTPTTTCLERRDVGNFEWHDPHNHWHLRDFATYELRRLAGGAPDMSADGLVSTSGKVSFCLIDGVTLNQPDIIVLDPAYTVDHADEDVDWALAIARHKITTCSFESQGISPGWGDVYSSDLPGQFVSLSGVADGEYALLNIVNPTRSLFESVATDNEAWVRVHIATLTPGGREVTIIG